MNYKSLSYGERFVYIVPVLPAVGRELVKKYEFDREKVQTDSMYSGFDF